MNIKSLDKSVGNHWNRWTKHQFGKELGTILERIGNVMGKKKMKDHEE